METNRGDVAPTNLEDDKPMTKNSGFFIDSRHDKKRIIPKDVYNHDSWFMVVIMMVASSLIMDGAPICPWDLRDLHTVNDGYN